jgi:hypothetical protein
MLLRSAAKCLRGLNIGEGWMQSRGGGALTQIWPKEGRKHLLYYPAVQVAVYYDVTAVSTIDRKGPLDTRSMKEKIQMT